MKMKYTRSKEIPVRKIKEMVDTEYLRFSEEQCSTEDDNRLLEIALLMPDLLPPVYATEQELGGIRIVKNAFVISFFYRLFTDQIKVENLSGIEGKGDYIDQFPKVQISGKTFSELPGVVQDALYCSPVIRIVALKYEHLDCVSQFSKIMNNSSILGEDNGL